MTSCGESLTEATGSTSLPLSRTTLTFGAWNVRTMLQGGKTSQVADEMKNYGLTCLGLSETRWIKSGEKNCGNDIKILYSGHEDENAPHTEGVALMISQTAQKALIGWEPHGPRIISATFKTNSTRVKLNIIQCYAPTNDNEEATKAEFYDRLQNVLNKLSERDMNIIMGDFNAKIGSDNTGYEEIMGVHGVGTMNENGELFTNLCADNKFVIGGSIFPHKSIHKTTWVSPDHVTVNQIDHICISKRFRRSLQDVRVKRGADIASDHHLLVCKLKLKLKRNENIGTFRKKQYNTILLKDPAKQREFQLKLTNKFEALQNLQEEDEVSIESIWETTKDVITSTCEEVIGHRKRNHKPWITPETLRKVEERKRMKAVVNNSRTRAAKAKAQEQYTKSNKEVKKSIKEDKHRYFENLATEAEQAAGSGNLKQLYDITRKLSGKYSKPERPVNDKHGNPITTKEGQMNRWAEHFESLLNRSNISNAPDIQPAETDLNINCERPTKQEIRKAILRLKNGKATGPDHIPAEALKTDIDTTVNMFYKLFGKIWNDEKMPLNWKESHIIKLPKKGDLRNCSNYRGISLLSVPGKVFNRIVLERIRDAADTKLRDEQAGFRKNRSCIDQIATLRIIVEQSTEWNSPLYINFIDYEKAFDSIDRTALWMLLRHYGIPSKLVNLIKCSYEEAACRVVHQGHLTKSFTVKTGVKQGCLLSPFLFIIAMDWIMRRTTDRKNNGIQWTLMKQLDDLDFADDLAILSHNARQMQEKTNILVNTSYKVGLKINRSKTKLMKINTNNDTPILLEGESLEEVDEFIYLGSTVDKVGGADADIKNRIRKARASFQQLKNVWNTNTISTTTKTRLFNTIVKPVLLYGSETWKLTKTNTTKIQTFINTCLRKIFKIYWPEKINNNELWQRAKQEPIQNEIGRRRWRWLGHTLRKPVDNTTRQALTWTPQGKRTRGRPKSTWRRDLMADTKRTGLVWKQVERTAQDRERWRSLVGGLYPHTGDRPK